MSGASEVKESQVTGMNNEGFANASSLQIRLDTDPMLNRIDFMLRGYREKLEIKDGNPVMTFVNDGEALANDIGTQYILGWLRMVVNPQVVQGNFDDERYTDFLCRHRKAIATNIMLNINRFSIKEENYGSIIDMIMSNLEAFMSRLIDNKERDSYSSTIRSVESTNSSLTEKGGVKLFNR